jgi:TRAP-type C4-dicarboxylate transport system permease small subunit
MNKFCSILIRLLELAMAVGLFAIAATVVLQVILSNCFNSSITGANEIITKLFVYVTAIGAAVAIGKREHIAITFATDRLPTNLRRLVEILGLFLVAVLNLVVVAYSFHWIRITGHYLMPTTQLPRFVAQLSVPVGSAIAILFCLVRMFSPAECEHAAPTEPKP